MAGEETYVAGVPIYLQIMDKMKHRIVTGTWAAGERIPSVRDLAIEFGVNPNTMQRALTELEREGMLFSERTAGRFVTNSAEAIASMRKTMADSLMQSFWLSMEQLGFTHKEVADWLLREVNDLKTTADIYENADQDKSHKEG